MTRLGGKEIDAGVALPAETEMTASLPTGSDPVTEISPAMPDIYDFSFPHSEKLELSERGIHELRLATGMGNTTLRLEGENLGDYCVTFQNGPFTAWCRNLKEAWFYIPPNALELTFSGEGILVRDDRGVQVYPESETAPLKSVSTIGIERREVLWKVEFIQKNWSFQADGIPVILTESPDFARRLEAGIVRMADGTVVAHRFQERALAWITWALAPGRVGDTAELLALLYYEPENFTFQDVRDYQRPRGAYGMYPHLKFAL